VIAIIPAADRSKATVKVRVAIRQKDPRIVPDMGVRVSFLGPGGAAPATAAGAVLVPEAAVRAEGDRGVVFVLTGEKVERRAVTLGQKVASERRVVSGLRAGERVVVSPPDSLRDGDAVKLAQGG
jgi:multidrug efflux pump subunit AcrA (membrane-fusion protein)